MKLRISEKDFKATFNRRTFLKYSSLAAAAGLGLRESPGADCKTTSPDILGPFYQPNAPFRTQLASPAEPGARLSIQGAVSDCNGPVKRALVEVWHANAEGCYSINQKCGVVPGNPDEFRLRGQLRTDDQGRYSFQTIKPAPYIAGKDQRPSHIHYKVSLPAPNGKGAIELITQLYFEGDKYNQTDPYSSKPEAKSRTIPLKTHPSTGSLGGTFNLVIPTPPESQKSSLWTTEGHDLLVHRDHGTVRFILPDEFISNGFLCVYTAGGSIVREWKIVGNTVQWNVEKTPLGIYVARLTNSEAEETVHIRL